MTTTDAEAIARIIVDDFSDIIEVAKRCADRTRSTFVINRQHATTMIAGRILSYLASRREAVANDDIANALEKCDWSGASIGNKAIISAAIERLRENVLFCQDATDHLALIDYIADKIGLPKNEELSRENFATWLAASRREAQEPVAGELLPCPFCGGAAETDSQQAYRNISTGRTETAVAVYCTSCGAQHTICRGDVPDAELTDITGLWNKRAAPPSPVPAPAGEAERLRGEIAYALTKRLVIDMPTARAAIDEAFAALNGGRE